MNNIGTYKEVRSPAFRQPTLDTLEVGRKKHHVPILLEADVTAARESMRKLSARTGERLSFTGWAMKCIAQALSEHPHIQAMRKGNRHLVLFDDVDISVLVERNVGKSDRLSEKTSEKLPMPYIVRRVNQKSVREIHAEIRAAQTEKIEAGEVQLGAKRNAALTRAFALMPKSLRNLLIWQRLARDPFFAKRTIGTAVVTSVGSGLTGYSYGWAIPISLHPVCFALGNVAKKPGVISESIEIREYLCLTVLFDHDVTDGVPASRFVHRLKSLLEEGFGLDEE